MLRREQGFKRKGGGLRKPMGLRLNIHFLLALFFPCRISSFPSFYLCAFVDAPFTSSPSPPPFLLTHFTFVLFHFFSIINFPPPPCSPFLPLQRQHGVGVTHLSSRFHLLLCSPIFHPLSPPFLISCSLMLRYRSSSPLRRCRAHPGCLTSSMSCNRL